MKGIVGPIQNDLISIGLKSEKIILATAFYSRGVLDNLNVEAGTLHIFVRLDLSSIDEWVAGSIDPAALLRFYQRHLESCDKVSIKGSADAHAKVYMGDKGYLTGSANLTRKGLAGLGHEILWFEESRVRQKIATATLKKYGQNLTDIYPDDLKSYVANNQERVKHLAAKYRQPGTDENRALQIGPTRPARFGDYEDFLNWLKKRSDQAAIEIYARANGKGALSGHIHRNFYGLRQLLLARPALAQRSKRANPSQYSLVKDAYAVSAIKDFVVNEAADESSFVVDTWRTYLPEKCGGKPKTGGGTSGNLNRMLPLIARYLAKRIH